MKIKSIIITALFIFFAAGISAQENQIHQKNKNEKSFMNIPDLTDTQKEQIKEMRTEHMKEVMPLKNELKEKEARLQTVSTGDNADLNNIYSVIDEISIIKTDLAKKRAAFKFEVRKVLTEDQRVYFDMHSPKKHHQKGMMHKQHHMQK